MISVIIAAIATPFVILIKVIKHNLPSQFSVAYESVFFIIVTYICIYKYNLQSLFVVAYV